MMANAPVHKNEHTGNPMLDRIQGNLRELITYVQSLAWLTRHAYVDLTVNKSIGVAAYAPLIQTTITTASANSFILVNFTASGDHPTNLGNVAFQIVVDNVAVKGCGMTAATAYGFNAATVLRVPVKRGAHTVVVQWKTDVLTARINAASSVNHHAAMSIREVIA